MITRLVALLIVLAAVLTPQLPAAAAPATPLLPPSSGPYFGPMLDWSSDSAARYARRLGARPAVYAQTVHYPLTGADGRYLAEFVAQAAGQGALALVDLEPTEPLRELDAPAARALAAQLAALHRRYGTAFYVRFASEMNGSWNAWGQHPRTYRAAFRTVAAAVHAALPRSLAAMVWQPVYGAGYPFRRAIGRLPQAGPADARAMDTNGDGRVTDADDPYRPYWPGDTAVDWVGLSAYDYGRARHHVVNRAPRAGRYLRELAGQLRYGARHGQGRAFVRIWAAGHHKPMLVETAALFDPSAPGQSALQVEQTWLRQVLSPVARRRYPQIRMVVWLEQRRQEPEAGGRLVDWRATASPALAGALRTELRAAHVAPGPVVPVVRPGADRDGTGAGNGAAGRTVAHSAPTASAADPMPPGMWAALGFAAAVAVFAVAFRSRSRRSRRPSRAAPGR